MTHPPRNVKIGSTGYEVLFTVEPPFDAMGRRLCGFIDSDAEQIIIHNDLTDNQKKHTLMHEAIHGVDFFLEIGLSEEQTEKMGKGLMMIFQDNRELIEYLFGRGD